MDLSVEIRIPNNHAQQIIQKQSETCPKLHEARFVSFKGWWGEAISCSPIFIAHHVGAAWAAFAGEGASPTSF